MTSVDFVKSALALICTAIPIVACIAAGSMIGRGRPRWPGADLLVGFGLLSSALTILAVATRIPLSWLALGLGLVSVLAALLRWQCPGGRSTWIAFILASPILFSAATQEPARWDDFWNWLPSAAYEFWNDSLPWPGLAPSLSIFPGYPQAMPLTIAAASFVRRQFLEAAGPIINVMLLAGSSALLAEAMAAARARSSDWHMSATRPAPAAPLVLVAVATAITILLNPGLDGAEVMSSYADCGTMIAVGALGLLGVEILVRLSASDSADVEGLAWRFGFIAAMLVNLKQANPVLLVLVTTGLILIALRVPTLRTRTALLQLPRMLGPSVIVFLVWRWYVSGLPDSEQVFRSFDDWNFDALSQILTSIGIYVGESPLLHVLMWTVTAAGLICFFQSPAKANAARWLAIICATVWLGYNAFLMVVYLGVMSDSDAYGAADYWRYTTHVALLGLYPPVMALMGARRPQWITLRSPALVFLSIALALCALPFRSVLDEPPGAAWQRFVRTATAEMRKEIAPGSQVVIVSFPVPNSFPFGVAVRYGLWQFDQPEQKIDTTIRWDDRDLAEVTSAAARGEADYLIIHDADGNSDETTDLLGLPRLNKELALFIWRDGGWKKLGSWPIPPSLVHRKRAPVPPAEPKPAMSSG